MKKKNLLFFFSIFCFFCSFTGSAQYTTDIEPTNPVTPNEAAMFKPVAQPIGSFSGIPPIEIPLLSGGQSKFPVSLSLSYNSAGFKVEEFAGSTGLGWSLNAGGSITRVIHGRADDLNEGYANNPDYKPSTVLGYSTYSQLEPVMNDARVGNLDIQPDEFFFSAPGLSGKFFFDENKIIHVENQEGITVTTRVNDWEGENAIVQFVLTDKAGNTYYFGQDKNRDYGAFDQNSVSYTSSNGYTNIPPNSQVYLLDWHLVEIDDIRGNSMARFYYGNNENAITSRLEAYTKIQTGPTETCEPGESYTSDETWATSTVYESYLTSITTPVDQFTFYSDLSRIDDPGEVRYDSIRQTDLSGNLKKCIHFNYGYFYQPYFPTGQDYYYKRLELLNVSEFGAYGSDSIAHRFDYNTTSNLGSRNSRGQDYWGYYNGQDANWTLMPNGSYTAMGVTVSEGSLGERRPIWPNPSSNLLTKIHYPTGGTRAFTYEPNTALVDPASSATPDDSFFNHHNIDTSVFNTLNYSNPQYTASFTINSQAGGSMWNFYIDGSMSGGFSVKILQGSTTLMTFSSQYSGSMSFQNGSYTVQLWFNIGSAVSYFNYYWDDLDMNLSTVTRFGRSLYEDNNTAGGCRIKEIDDYDPVSKQTISTFYKYNLFTDSLHTSGLLITPVNSMTDMSCLACDYIRLCANTNYPLAQQSGNYVNYTDVRTYQTNNGHMDQRFSFDFDNMQGQSIGALSTPQDNSWRRSKLLSTAYYDKNNNLLRIDSTVYYILAGNTTFYLDLYDYRDTVSLSNILFKKTLGFKIKAWIDPVYAGTLDYCYTPWYLTSLTCQPDYTISHIYTPNGTQTVQTNYTYWTSIGQPFIQQSQQFLNNSTTSLTNYRYSFNASTAFKLPMTGGNLLMADTLLMINYLQPIEVTTYKQKGADTSFVEGMQYQFDRVTFDSLGHTYLPVLARHYTMLNKYSDMNYPSFDRMANLTEQYKTGDAHTVWLWGYNYTRPVAKIVGSNYSTVLSYINTTTLQWPTSDNDIRTQVNLIRTALAGTPALVTTYSWTPVYGMTSEVDPTGTIIFYDYDNHGRLLDIRDQNNDILKRFSYTVNNP